MAGTATFLPRLAVEDRRLLQEKSVLGQSIESRPAAGRARHYRDLAAEAMRMAEAAATESLRAGYLAMASGWHALAQEAERLAESAQQRPPNPGPAPDQPNGN
jgi:hypothetical protein